MTAKRPIPLDRLNVLLEPEDKAALRAFAGEMEMSITDMILSELGPAIAIGRELIDRSTDVQGLNPN